ncbi:purine-nucleoside phosphorylase [Fulvivirgaceae bacterium BMA12]|uniref:Purine nucleoside phosphorylase n=1 Tax=Agaribacillus aureus TaxID=3051825 RepID=A0ABT8L8F5_9BACT|nr:purine-nucleoside phosphorylase [Fulvivirgaceae bacterium BMA12]
MLEKIKAAYTYIQERIQTNPEFGIILGTGLGSLVTEVEVSEVIHYEDIPDFPVSTVESHKGKLIFGELAGKQVVVMQGRFHYYEGYSMQQVTFPLRVMKLLGIKKLFVSNAAGGLDKNYQISDLMIIKDHINLMPENPLTGENMDEFGGRFPDMSEPYDLKLIQQAMEIAQKHDLNVHQGVYAAVTGPNLETRAEYKYLRIIGADAVGMSTVPEVIVAQHMEMPCFAISAITDLCIPETLKKVSVPEIIAAAMKAEPGMTKIVKELVRLQ